MNPTYSALVETSKLSRKYQVKHSHYCPSDHQLADKYSDCKNGFRMSILMNEVTTRLSALPLVSVCLLQVGQINSWKILREL